MQTAYGPVRACVYSTVYECIGLYTGAPPHLSVLVDGCLRRQCNIESKELLKYLECMQTCFYCNGAEQNLNQF
jgi:hypothetical protein